MKLLPRILLCLASGVVALAVTPRSIWAQTYPTRPVHLIVGFFSGRPARHWRTADSSSVVGAARPAIHC